MESFLFWKAWNIDQKIHFLLKAKHFLQRQPGTLIFPSICYYHNWNQKEGVITFGQKLECFFFKIADVFLIEMVWLCAFLTAPSQSSSSPDAIATSSFPQHIAPKGLYWNAFFFEDKWPHYYELNGWVFCSNLFWEGTLSFPAFSFISQIPCMPLLY